jgi:hypothetical protein
MLANGSTDADVTAELVWVGSGTAAEVEAAGVAGKIAVTDGSIGGAARLACRERGALGVVAIGNSRPHFDPLQIPWSGVGSRGAPAGSGCFGFFIPPREAETLKTRLLRGETITVHAQVEATMRSYEMPDPVAYIPGADPEAPEIILSAHLFEGYVKQGANDNLSGSAALLEVARTLHTLIEDGRIPRPRRTIRFLWGPEYSGTGPWVVANKELMERTLANINLDMVGEWLSLNKGFMTLVRTTYGGPHFINDVMENYYRFVGEGNRERIQNRRDFPLVPRRIVAPSGADEPFYYSIETHYGSSDHMVFNDWGVQVPGIMMIAWPDQWYHTSGDRPDKSDPTQLKRVVIIAAAGAYTVAAADDAMAMRLAGEIASNGTRRLGHQFVMGLERLNHATGPDLNQSYRWARAHVEAGLANESATLATVLQLAERPHGRRRRGPGCVTGQPGPQGNGGPGGEQRPSPDCAGQARRVPGMAATPPGGSRGGVGRSALRRRGQHGGAPTVDRRDPERAGYQEGPGRPEPEHVGSPGDLQLHRSPAAGGPRRDVEAARVRPSPRG